MPRRETVALRFLLPPPDHLPPALGDGAGVVLQQHPAQHVHRGQLAQPGRGGAVIDRLQQRVPVAGVGDRQLIAPGLGDRGPPGGHRGAVAAGEIGHADPLLHPVRVRGRQRLQRGPHAFPGQFQPVQRRHRRDDVRGVGALLAARPDQALSRQLCQQRVQHHLLQAVGGDPGPELGQHRMVKARIATRQAQRVLPVDPGAHRLGGLTVGEVLRLLEDRHQRQARRRPARLATHPVGARELLIGQPPAELVAHQHRQRTLTLALVHRGNVRSDLRRGLRPRLRHDRHHKLQSAACTGEGGGGRRPQRDHAEHKIPKSVRHAERPQTPTELTTRVAPRAKTPPRRACGAARTWTQPA